MRLSNKTIDFLVTICKEKGFFMVDHDFDNDCCLIKIFKEDLVMNIADKEVKKEISDLTRKYRCLFVTREAISTSPITIHRYVINSYDDLNNNIMIYSTDWKVFDFNEIYIYSKYAKFKLNENLFNDTDWEVLYVR